MKYERTLTLFKHPLDEQVDFVTEQTGTALETRLWLVMNTHQKKPHRKEKANHQSCYQLIGD